MSDTNDKEDKPPLAGKAAGWWRDVNDDATGDRGALARLRRANFPLEAWAEPQTMRLYRMLGFRSGHRDDWVEPVAILAIVLAGVREDKGRSLGKALGEGEPPAMHPLRLRRLTAARDAKETLRGFREAVALLKDAAPVADLARCVLGWLDPDPDMRDRARTRFLFAYHGAGFAAPSQFDDSNGAEDAEPTELTS
jgi:CRISPR system Cascade subunit CasB